MGDLSNARERGIAVERSDRHSVKVGELLKRLGRSSHGLKVSNDDVNTVARQRVACERVSGSRPLLDVSAKFLNVRQCGADPRPLLGRQPRRDQAEVVVGDVDGVVAPKAIHIHVHREIAHLVRADKELIQEYSRRAARLLVQAFGFESNLLSRGLTTRVDGPVAGDSSGKDGGEAGNNGAEVIMDSSVSL